MNLLWSVGQDSQYHGSIFSFLVISISLLVICQPVSAISSDAACFSINGVPNTDFPCFLGQSVSACCGTNSICLDNGLCKPVDSVGVSELIRGSCTDQTWLSPSCPDYCVGAILGGTNLISCENVTNSQSDFCCDHTTDCCDSGIGRFRVPGAFTAVVTIGSTAISVTKTEPGAKATSTSTSRKSTTSSTLVQRTSTSVYVASSETAISQVISSTPTATATATPSPLPATGGNGIKIGIGLGVAGVVSAIAASIVIYYTLRKRKRSHGPETESSSISPVTLEASNSPVYGKYESESCGKRYEVDGLGRPAEMETKYNPVYEFPSAGVWGKSQVKTDSF